MQSTYAACACEEEEKAEREEVGHEDRDEEKEGEEGNDEEGVVWLGKGFIGEFGEFGRFVGERFRRGWGHQQRDKWHNSVVRVRTSTCNQLSDRRERTSHKAPMRF